VQPLKNFPVVKLLRNMNELHCDGTVYNIFKQANATGCLNTELN
jgi:hypothetical protein